MHFFSHKQTFYNLIHHSQIRFKIGIANKKEILIMRFHTFYFSGNPYFRVILSSFDALSIYALNVSESDVGSGYAEDGDGIVLY